MVTGEVPDVVGQPASKQAALGAAPHSEMSWLLLLMMGREVGE